MDALAPALYAANDRVETTKEILQANQPLTVDERVRLVTELEAAMSELASLRTAYEQVIRSSASRERPSPTPLANAPYIARFLRRLRSYVSSRAFLSGNARIIQEQVRDAVFGEQNMSLSREDISYLRANDILTQDGTLTDRAFIQFLDQNRTPQP
ncbi:hypothetical protein [Roseateles sp.]|uniref:hypothetical protein n=1 Tax=Roseateles sp. TaxID=1971397 RepID=UPI0031E0B8A9